MNKNNTTYTAKDFANYHSGNMPYGDMHALEKAALEDPFLSDALEGYMHSDNYQVELNAIDKKFSESSSNNKVVKLKPTIQTYWWRIAAAAIVFMGLGYVFINFNKKTADNTIAQVTTINEPIVNQNTNDSAVVINDLKTNTTKVNEQISTEKSVVETKKVLPKQDVLSPTPSIAQAPVPFTPQVSEGVVVTQKTTLYPTQNAPSIFNNNSNNQISSGPKQIAQNNNQANNKPYVDISLKKEKFKTLNDSFSNKELAYNVDKKATEGYTKKSNEAEQNAEEKLEDVVVTANGNKKSAAKSRSTNDALDGKVAGLEVNAFKKETTAFNEYVKQHIKPVFDSNGNEIKGTVKLSFKTNKAGKPIKIKVAQSLNKSCNEQAIQLLNSGSIWSANISSRIFMDVVF